MEIDINGEIYDIRWRHERVVAEIRTTDKDGRDICVASTVMPNGGITVAYIFGKDGNPIEAYANCSRKDCYNKKLGRIIATGRLFKMLNLDTKQVKKLW